MGLALLISQRLDVLGSIVIGVFFNFRTEKVQIEPYCFRSSVMSLCHKGLAIKL